MGIKPEQTFFQRRHTDGQQAHERMLNIVNQRNENQNHNEISPHTCLNGYNFKKSQITNIGKIVEKRNPLYTIGGNVNWCSHCGKQYGGSPKTKNRTTI